MTAVSEQLAREQAEPHEGRGPLSPLLILLVGALGFFAVDEMLTNHNDDPYGFGGDHRSAYVPQSPELSGKELYGQRCATCHQPDGQGVSGAFPPLAGSAWLTEDPQTPIRILLRGISGPIEVRDATYNGAMPRFSELDDPSVARVLTHVRSSWGNEGEAITAAQVAEVRAELAGRTATWSGGEELEQMRANPEPP